MEELALPVVTTEDAPAAVVVPVAASVIAAPVSVDAAPVPVPVAAASELPTVAVTVTVCVGYGETFVLNLILQTASVSKVNGIFRASHSEVWRWIESKPSQYTGTSRKPTPKLTGQDRSIALLSHTAKVPLTVFLLGAHACCVVGARAAGETSKEASVLQMDGR